MPAERHDARILRDGSRAEISALEHPMRREMVDAMKQSTTAGRFERLEDAQRSCSLRLKAVEPMTNFNTGKWDADDYNPSARIGPQIGNTASPGDVSAEARSSEPARWPRDRTTGS